MSNSDVIRRMLVGDKRALTSFYKTYAPRLLGYIEEKVNNPKDAEEILQDTLFAFLDGLRDFNGTSSVSTFLYAICRHKVADYYRRKKVKQVVFSRMPQLETLVSPLLTPEEELDSRLFHDRIHRTLGRIIPRYREILLLKYMDNLTVEDIADRLATTLKGAESQLFRARKAFVEAFLSV
ncbi:sigma-70 family RNA polymerase sigma factor [Patescibacteria group bacterium]|nr:sigma-70 family RNA polymerase sigma factor [Patescibacteria group bacterium]